MNGDRRLTSRFAFGRLWEIGVSRSFSRDLLTFASCSPTQSGCFVQMEATQEGGPREPVLFVPLPDGSSESIEFGLIKAHHR